jgi:very-short-patch-repair endonuclease
MERYVEEFRRLDKEQQELAKIEVQHQVTKRRPSLDLEHASSAEQVLVRREAEKQRKHKPLRELFDEAGSFITQLTPCFMMSPLSVAQYLKADSIQFDTVVFDEASQIMPQDAVSSLIRADQAVIAGDTKQLPPTSFFQSDVETTEDVREDLDSILEETASVLPEKNLRWHYRSRTEELIQFSNYHYYNNSLRTFPENDPDVETGVSFEYVEDGVYDRGESRQNEVEAQRVIDLIEEHAEERSDKSLGVVAFSSAQEQAIRDALAERREESPVLDAFVSQDDVLDEFFIKNLEMVQGDERDRMIFSVGYGPAQDGTISTNFGPINKSGGERRLNVAVTRAKEHITVVCSMLPGDIDLSGSNSTGAKHFKNYLEYARKGEQALVRDDEVTDTLDFDSRFEEAVYEALESEGYDIVSQVQSSSYSIDLAIKHPEQPGKFILGIECDGAAYHSSKTARDRDRTRQMVLEDLGWTIHRIWSPDWASNQKREIRKINEKVENLLEGQSFSKEDRDIPEYEPEVMEVDSKDEHDEITEFEEPSLEWHKRYDPDKQGMNQANRNSIRDTVVQNGPIQYDTAVQTYLDVWGQSRAGQKVQRIFRNRLDELTKQDKVHEHGEFLWPPLDEFEFNIRINTDSATRTIDEIPLEEIAKAITVVLQEGGAIKEDDIVLETTRLFGYQRRGDRIKSRINEALDLLEEKNLITTDDRITLNTARDPDTVLLSRIYPSVSESATSDASPRQTSDDAVPSSQERADSFPFLNYDRSQWQVPCPYCDTNINNTKEAFMTHWANAERCSGPGPRPPETINQISHSEWKDIVNTIESRTSEKTSSHSVTQSPSNGGEKTQQVQPPEADLDIKNPDGSFPWLNYPDKGWKVPCPYCDEKVFNSEDAFRSHWSDNKSCPESTNQHFGDSTENLGNGTNQPSTRVDELSTLFKDHLERDDHSDHWIDLMFENDGETDSHYQYLNGVHNLTRLTSSQKAALEEVVDEYDLTIDTEGDNYATVSSDSQQPDVEANLCLSLLRTVYDTTIEEVKQASEHGNGYKAW